MNGGVRIDSTHPIDAPFAAAYARHPAPDLVEQGFAGHLGSPPDAELERAHSAWLPGDDAETRLRSLTTSQRHGSAFRFLFAERYHAPSVEAHALFTGKHLGMRLHFLVKVQAHAERLLAPDRWREPAAWLREPLLNRLPLAVWMMGPVLDVRLLQSSTAASSTVVVMLRHSHPQRLSILELSVSTQLTHGGQPAILDRFECTGTDGFLRVNGIWDNPLHLPRLELHRGAIESVQRDLPRELGTVYEHAALHAGKLHKQSDESYGLAVEYLRACARLT